MKNTLKIMYYNPNPEIEGAKFAAMSEGKHWLAWNGNNVS
jgi:hypothetical protein